ncbi:4-pyridoxate dehydrogenase [Dendroctonus ponderosae]|uniref:4-pyridoxate dehydrogenase n=1 Tax=Dendroctonus ponderosae TaxID=77166 RepID=UPI0020358145|nr:4-pyridoxate dehydrogenase [Dendroctonus ponderosae]
MAALVRVLVVALWWCQVVINASLTEYSDVAIAQRVERLVANLDTYVFPVNNDAFFETVDDLAEDPCVEGDFDFIIVGTGSAGGVLANRLTEVANFTVLALEAGEETPVESDMLGVNIYLHRTRHNWGYNTTVQENMCLGSVNARCPYPRGKMLGGSSAINFGMYVRGHHDDFDHWEALGNPGWAYDDVLPYFKKAESATFGDDIDLEYHGFGGPQKTGVPNDTPVLTQALIDCHIDLGKTEKDYNGKDQDGVSRLQFFLDGNTRSSSNEAFLKPVRRRPNLVVSTESYVTRILITNQTAEGVVYMKNGKECTVRANKEVLLSAGAINSPQVLMLSGVGPQAELEKHGIELIQDLPVGQNMQDHQFFPGIFYRTNQTLYNITLLQMVDLWKRNLRPLTPSLGQQTVSFWNFIGPEDSQPEVEFFFFGPPLITPDIAVILGYTEEYVEIFNLLDALTDISVNVELLHPRSTGSVTLQSSDPRDFPVIDPNYFSDPEGVDLENVYKGVEVALQFNDTETFRSLDTEFLLIPYPECDAQYDQLSKDWWYCAIKTLASTLFHPVATTKMGPDAATSVVDSQLKVHGVDRLRVVDAGVFPDHISGHPNAAVVMIAEKIADEIKSEHLGCSYWV